MVREEQRGRFRVVDGDPPSPEPPSTPPPPPSPPSPPPPPSPSWSRKRSIHDTSTSTDPRRPSDPNQRKRGGPDLPTSWNPASSLPVQDPDPREIHGFGASPDPAPSSSDPDSPIVLKALPGFNPPKPVQTSTTTVENQQQPIKETPFPLIPRTLSFSSDESQQSRPQSRFFVQKPSHPQFQPLIPQLPVVSTEQQQIRLRKADGSSAEPDSMVEDLDPESQKILSQIKERILQYKSESESIDQCSRLYDLSTDNFYLEAKRILQEIKGLSSALQRARIPAQTLKETVNTMIENVETAVRSYMTLTSLRPISTSPNIVSSVQQRSVFSNGKQLVSSFYGGPRKKPTLFLQNTVDAFEKKNSEFCKWIKENEELLLRNNAASLDLLPQIMSNVHAFFLQLASKVEGLHQTIKSMKGAHLLCCRQQGDTKDPFLDADRKQIAREEADARRVHPTLHLSATSQQILAQVPHLSVATPQQIAGLLPSASPSGSSFHQYNLTPSAQSFSQFGFSGFQPQPQTFQTVSPSLPWNPTTLNQPSNQFGSVGFSSQPINMQTASTSQFKPTKAPSCSFPRDNLGLSAPSRSQFGCSGFPRPSFAYNRTAATRLSSQFDSIDVSPQPMNIEHASTSQFGPPQVYTSFGLTAPSFASTGIGSSSTFSTPGADSGFAVGSTAVPSRAQKPRSRRRAGGRAS